MRKAVIGFCWIVLLLAAASFAAAQSDYKVISVTDGGTISGTVKWSGPAPKDLEFPITKDPQICEPDGKKTANLERLVVGPEGGVANTIVYLKNIFAGKSLDSFPEQRRHLDQKHCRYIPHILLVPKDAALSMQSSDATLHTIHMDGAASYNLPFPFPDQVVSRDMQSAGLVNLKCNGGHVWMNAEMFVAPHPYYTVTDESGKFELTNIPPGQYVLIAWHEGWGVERQESAFDVLTEKRVQRPVFSEPRVLEKKVTVSATDTTVVSFVLSEK